MNALLFIATSGAVGLSFAAVIFAAARWKAKQRRPDPLHEWWARMGGNVITYQPRKRKRRGV